MIASLKTLKRNAKKQQSEQERLEAARLAMQTEFLKSIEHLRLSVFDARIGQKAQVVQLWKGKEYEPHLEETIITHLFRDGSVTDWSGYYILPD